MMAFLTTMLLATTVSSGCLFTGRLETAPETNLAPSVESCCAMPDLAEIVVINSAPTGEPIPTAFDISKVTDPNVDDDLFVRWFIDGGTLILADQLLAPVEDPAHRDPVRDPEGALGVEVPLEAFANLVGTHRVEVIIADRPFSNANPPADNREAGAEANAVYLFWQVEFTEF